MSVNWYLFMVLLCIALIVNDVKHLSCAYWQFVYLLWGMSV